MNIDCQRLNGRLIQAVVPGRHNAAAAIGNAIDDCRLVRTIEPDRVSEIWRAKVTIALAFCSMTGSSIFIIDFLTFGCWRDGVG